MRVQVCGALRVEGEGTTLVARDLPGRLGRRLWVFLVLQRRRPVGTDEIASALWEDAIPDAWGASIHALVSRLRSALRSVDEEAALRSTGAGYELSLPADTLVDRERAWTAISHVRLLRQRGELAAAWTEAVIAHEIASRGFMPGEGGEWIEAERRLFRGIEVQALEAIIEAELARGRLDDVERLARTLIALDPLRESGYRLLTEGLGGARKPAAVAAVNAEREQAIAAAGLDPDAAGERVRGDR